MPYQYFTNQYSDAISSAQPIWLADYLEMELFHYLDPHCIFKKSYSFNKITVRVDLYNRQS